MINMIIRGSEICRLTSFAAKRKLRESQNVYSIRSGPTQGSCTLTFTEEEASGINAPHYDALIIKISIANLTVKRVLVDDGSSANILFHERFKNMQLDERRMHRKVLSLIGFDGKATSTIGEIELPVFAEGIFIPHSL